MRILALDTATPEGSVAVAVDGDCHVRVGDAARTHAERLPADLLACLADAGTSLAEVDLFAVIAGPGSFTGLRVGVATLQGLALASGRLIVPVSTLDAMADDYLADARPATPPVILAVLDGQRGEVFYAAWQAEGDHWIDRQTRLIEPRVGGTDELRLVLIDAWPSSATVVVVHDTGSRFMAACGAWPTHVRTHPRRRRLAEVATWTAARRPDLAVGPHALRPFYIRRPDAVVARDRARGASGDDFVIGRVAATDDLSAIEALQRRAFTNAWGAEALQWELANTDVARLYTLRDAAGTLIAYCACWMIFDELHINSLAVDEAERRRGIATRLLTAVFADVRQSGARAATLEVRQSNVAARQLYERLGFVVEAVRRDYYQEPREDALILWNRQLATS